MIAKPRRALTPKNLSRMVGMPVRMIMRGSALRPFLLLTIVSRPPPSIRTRMAIGSLCRPLRRPSGSGGAAGRAGGVPVAMAVSRAAIRLSGPLRIRWRRRPRRMTVRGLRGPLVTAGRRARGRRVARGMIVAAIRVSTPLRIRRWRERVRRLLPLRGVGRSRRSSRFAESAATGVPGRGACGHARGRTCARTRAIAVARTGADAGGTVWRRGERARWLSVRGLSRKIGRSDLRSRRQRGESAEREAEESGSHFHFPGCVKRFDSASVNGVRGIFGYDKGWGRTQTS